MVDFPKEFFRSEKRCGFFVDSTMKAAWAAEIEVLNEVAMVCERHNLKWFADWGTLLGAVRHQGFVPWDDDIDIALLREDYEKLMEVLPQELPKGFKVYNSMHALDQEQFWSCVMNSDNISVEADRLEKFHGCPFICGIDIFPIDVLPSKKSDAELEASLFVLIWKAQNLAKLEERTPEQEEEFKLAIDYLEDYYQMKFDPVRDLVGQLCEMANRLCIRYSKKKHDYVVEYLFYMSNSAAVYQKEWFDEVEYVPFENIMVPIPKDYDKILRMKYGDYTVAVRGAAAHDYPFFKKQLKFLRETVKKREEEVLGKKDEV